MAYPKEIVNRAFEVLSERRNNSIAKNNYHKLEIEQALPQVAELDRQLTYTSADIAKAILSGVDIEEKMERLKNNNLYMQKKKKELLVAAGYPEDYLEDRFYCNDCNDKGYTNDNMCHCMKDLLKKLTLEKLGETADTSKYTFDNFSLECYSTENMAGRDISPRRIMAQTFETCRSYAENFTVKSPNLFFQGGTGLGKTHLSVAIAAKIIEKGYDVIYTPTQSLISKLENERFRKNGEIESYSEFVLNCDLLILDDLGSEFVNNFSSAIIYDIINSRLIEGCPTIINTNLSAKGIETAYSPRIVSRLRGEYKGIPFVGSDIRMMQK